MSHRDTHEKLEWWGRRSAPEAVPNNAEGLQGQGMCLALGQGGTVLGTSSTAEGDRSNLFQTTQVLQLRAATHSMAGAWGLEGMCGQCLGPVHPKALLSVRAFPRPPPRTSPALGRAPQAPGCCGQKHPLSQAQPSRGNSHPPTSTAFLQSFTLPHPHWSQAPSNYKTMPGPFLAPSLASTVEPDSRDGWGAGGGLSLPCLLCRTHPHHLTLGPHRAQALVTTSCGLRAAAA